MLLDTSFLIDLMRERSRDNKGPATEKLREIADQPVRLPLFVLCELMAGAEASGQPELEQERIGRLTQIMEIVYPGPNFPSIYGRNEGLLRRSGQPIPLMDLLIATLAIETDEAILTKDKDHFTRVGGLKVETY